MLIWFHSEETGKFRKLSRPWHGPYRVTSCNETNITAAKIYFPREDPIQVHKLRVKQFSNALQDSLCAASGMELNTEGREARDALLIGYKTSWPRGRVLTQPLSMPTSQLHLWPQTMRTISLPLDRMTRSQVVTLTTLEKMFYCHL